MSAFHLRHGGGLISAVIGMLLVASAGTTALAQTRDPGAGGTDSYSATTDCADCGPGTRGSNYRLRRHVIAGGGGQTSSPRFSLIMTLGQHDGGAPMSGGPFTLQGGFHRQIREPEVSDRIFANGFEF